MYVYIKRLQIFFIVFFFLLLLFYNFFSISPLFLDITVFEGPLDCRNSSFLWLVFDLKAPFCLNTFQESFQLSLFNFKVYCISWFICRRNSKKCNIFRFSIDMNSTVSMQSNIICWQGNVHCWITGKYGLNFEIQNLGLQSKAQSEKQISTLRNVSLDFLSFLFGKSEKGFEKKMFTSTVFSQMHTHS